MDSGSLPQTYKALAAKEDNLPRRLVELPLPKPAQNQILIKMAFIPINQSDLLCSKGFYRLIATSPYFVGLEGSGVIAEIGEGIKTHFQVGDKVHVHSRGTHAQFLLVNPEEISPISGDLSLDEAASHIVNPGTVSYMVALAVKNGHKAVVSTAASSALGKMLIRALKAKGIKSINTVRKDKYIEELKKEGADYVLNSESADFEAQLKEIAEKENATIAFDAINGDFTDKLIHNLPAHSTIHVYGMLTGVKYDLNGVRHLEHHKTVKGLLYTDYLEEFKQKGEMDKYYEEIHAPLKTIFKSEVQKIYPLDEIIEAFEYYETNSSKGKVLIKAN
jgi:NADPH:quinone reductase-like Zn-dependent oxidoreductase